jgi:hypothetical protein
MGTITMSLEIKMESDASDADLCDHMDIFIQEIHELSRGGRFTWCFVDWETEYDVTITINEVTP